MEKYWNEFDDDEENKLVYMEIFKEYVSVISKSIASFSVNEKSRHQLIQALFNFQTNVVEKYIENHLISNIDNFSMESFISQLQ